MRKTAYEMRISDWSSDLCSSDLEASGAAPGQAKDAGFLPASGPGPRRWWRSAAAAGRRAAAAGLSICACGRRCPSPPASLRIGEEGPDLRLQPAAPHRSEEHTSELQSLMRISYAVFCLIKKKNNNIQKNIK